MRQAGIHWIQEPDALTVARQAATIIIRWIADNPGSSVVFPTGATPRLLYELLRKNPDPRWEGMHLFHLDDYVPPTDFDIQTDLKYQTFEQDIRQQLWDHIAGFKHGFGEMTANPLRYEASLLAKGSPPGLIILGIGGNGHIAFNEPPCPPDTPTRIVNLHPDTIRTNFNVEAGTLGYPTQAATLGLKVILSAQKILLLATGEKKRAIIQKAFDPDTSPDVNCPASWLKLHPDVTILTDFTLR